MSFLLLHGAGLGKWIWDDVRPLLKKESRAIERPDSNPVEWSGIPESIAITYVKLLNDASVALKVQNRMIKRVRAQHVSMIDSGHLPMISQPARLAEILNASVAI